MTSVSLSTHVQLHKKVTKRTLKNAKRRQIPLYLEKCSQEEVQQYLDMQKRQKARNQRSKYHSMSPEERKVYNQRRTESYRKQRADEKALLEKRVGDATEAEIVELSKCIEKRQERAEKAKRRYAKMTPEQKRAHNQKRTECYRRQRERRAEEERNVQEASGALPDACDEYLDCVLGA